MQRLGKAIENEQGSFAPMFAILGLGLILLFGIVVDSNTRLNATEQATAVAQSAARAAAANVSDATGGNPVINTGLAQQAGQKYIAAAGMTGSVQVNGNTVSVSVQRTTRTIFVSMVGINSVTGTGTATAQLARR